MSDRWFYSRGGQQSGPLALAQLKQLATSGQLRGDDLVWSEGMADWLPASQVLDVFRSPAPSPPRPAALGMAAAVSARQPATPFGGENPYRTPQFTAPSSRSGGSGLAIAGFILGLLSLLAWCIPLFGLPITVVGLVLSIKGRKSEYSGLAIAGIVLNAIGLALTLVNGALGAYLAATGQHGLVNQFKK